MLPYKKKRKEHGKIKSSKVVLHLLFLFTNFLSAQFAFATTYYSTGADPSLVSSWKTNRDGTGSSPTAFSADNDIFIIQNIHSLTVSTAWTFGTSNPKNQQLKIEAAGRLTLNANLTFNANNGNKTSFIVDGILVCGNFVVAGMANFSLGNGATLQIGSNNGISTSGSTGNIQVSGTRTYASTTSKANFIYNGTTTQVTGDGLTDAQNLTISNSNTVTLSANVNVTGNLTISSGSLSASTFNIVLSGNWSNNGIFSAGTSTINLNGGAQSIGGTANTSFNNLTVAGTGVKTISNVTVNGTLSLEATGSLSAAPTYGASAKLQYNTTTARTAGPAWITPFIATGGVVIANTGAITLNEAKQLGSNSNVPLTINTGATLNTGNYGLTFHGDFSNSGTLAAGSSPITISGTVANQTIAGLTTTGQLGFTKTAGTASISGAMNASSLDVNGSGGTLVLGSSTHTFTNVNLTAGILNASSSILRVSGAWTGTSGFNASTGTVSYNGAAQSVAGLTYNNLDLTGGAKTAAADLTVTGALSVASGSTLNMGSNALLGSLNTITNNGTISTQNTSTTPFPVSKTWGGVVLFNGTAAQTVPAGTYNNLTLNNTAGAALALNSNATATALTLTAGSLSINANTLTVNSVSGTGTLSGSAASSLTITGTGSTLNFDAASKTLKNLTLNNNATANLGTALDITGGSTPGTVVVNSGATLNTGGFLTLKSDASGTARVGNSAGTISGNVTVETYISSGRKWRLLTAPVTGTTINASWQEGKTWDGATTEAATGFGTLITGNGQKTSGNANTNGFDFWTDIATKSSSLRTYTISGNIGNWNSFLNSTKSTGFDNNEAYLIYVRGDRSYSTGTGSSATVLRATGALKTGSTTTIPASVTQKYVLVGNPFASPIDFSNLYSSTPAGTILNRFWLIDATLGSGAYRLVASDGSGGYTTTPYDMGTPGSSSTAGNYINIPSGAGFFVEGDLGGTLTIAQGNKSSSAPSVFRRYSIPQTRLFVNLSNSSTTLDGVQVKYDDKALNEVESEDIAKPVNMAESFSIQRNGQKLMVEDRAPLLEKDTVFLNLSNLTTTKYQLKAVAENFTPGTVALLEDKYTGESTRLNLDGSITSVDFTINSDAASKNPNRFRIVFIAGVNSTLPVNFTNIKASRKATEVLVDWSVANETGIAKYEVERSRDGQQFGSIGTTNANNASSYSFNDVAPLTGGSFYRVRSVGFNGEYKYSELARIIVANGNSVVSIYPNPVHGNSFNLQLNNLIAGSYQLNIYNQQGQSVYSKAIQLSGSSFNEAINLSGKIAKGLYNLELAGHGSKTITKLIIQ